MIFLSDIFKNRHILSLRTGGAIGYAYNPIINPQNLKIEGWYASSLGEKGTMILPVTELRDIIMKGFVVDDHDAITPLDDIVRLKSIIDGGFELIGKHVETDAGRKVGKVAEYAVENKTLFVKKLYVNQGVLKSLLSFTRPQLIIDRAQIVDVTPQKIVVRDVTQKIKPTVPVAAST